jgi:hypothetical protein
MRASERTMIPPIVPFSSALTALPSLSNSKSFARDHPDGLPYTNGAQSSNNPHDYLVDKKERKEKEPPTDRHAGDEPCTTSVAAVGWTGIGVRGLPTRRQLHAADPLAREIITKHHSPPTPSAGAFLTCGFPAKARSPNTLVREYAAASSASMPPTNRARDNTYVRDVGSRKLASVCQADAGAWAGDAANNLKLKNSGGQINQ